MSVNTWKELAPFYIDPLIIRVYDPAASKASIDITPVDGLTAI